MVGNTEIRVIIVEDQDKARDFLIRLINKNFSNIRILAYSDNINDVVSIIDQKKPELIFMDIELKDGLSFEIFEKITFHDFEVVFTTAFESYMKKAIDHYAFNYLIKPISEIELINVIKRYQSDRERLFNKYKYQLLSDFLKSNDAYLFIHIGKEYISVKVDDIVKCEADGNYTYFNLSNSKRLLASNYLKYYEELLVQKGFFRANRSVLVNIKYIQSIYKKQTIILKNRDKITVSVRNKSNLGDLINSLS